MPELSAFQPPGAWSGNRHASGDAKLLGLGPTRRKVDCAAIPACPAEHATLPAPPTGSRPPILFERCGHLKIAFELNSIFFIKYLSGIEMGSATVKEWLVSVRELHNAEYVNTYIGSACLCDKVHVSWRPHTLCIYDFPGYEYISVWKGDVTGVSSYTRSSESHHVHISKVLPWRKLHIVPGTHNLPSIVHAEGPRRYHESPGKDVNTCSMPRLISCRAAFRVLHSTVTNVLN